MKTVTTENELGQALKDGEEAIIVKGDLAAKTFVIHATGKAAWVIAGGCLAVAICAGIAMLVPDPAEGVEAATAAAGLGGAVVAFKSATLGAALAAPALVSGVSAPAVAWSALLTGVAGGGIAALNSLRNYKLERIPGEKSVILRNKRFY